MLAWRLTVAFVLLLLVVLPLTVPLVGTLLQGQAWTVWEDLDRLLSLAKNSFLLLAGSLALALPAGVAAAVLLFRTDLPLRRGLRYITVLSLFVPLPVMVSAWQATLGERGWLPIALWQDRPGQPWPSGLAPAIWINSLAALPWVILLVGHGLCWVEGELEEDALLLVRPWRVLWHVTLPRCRAVIAAAAVWICLQTAAEITVTDMLEVRTFAEEVFLQFSAGGDAALARSVALSLPAVAVTWLGLVWLVPRLDRALPPLQTMAQPPRLFRLGWLRWPCGLGVMTLALLVGLVPLASLLWKAGLHGWPQTWTISQAWERISTTFLLDGAKVLQSLVCAGLTGFLVASLALLSCWVAIASRCMRLFLLSLLALAWSLPGPVAGIGLKETILLLVTWVPVEPIETALYRGPSFAPIVWAHLLRFFPCAVALLWPVVRMIPQELRNAAQLEGARPRQELLLVVWPLCARVFLWSALAVAALALGEIAASKLAETPGAETFAHLLFARMHYGADNDVAALCLVLVGAVVTVGLGLALAQRLWRNWTG
jgi:iron(III) transport system permease protein